MSEIKALDKLRNSSHLDDDKWTLETGDIVTVFGSRPNDPNAVNWGERWRKIADEIEAEIADNYMRLPVDADGVPIHVGDEMTCHGDVFTVCAVAPAKIHRWVTVKLGEPQTTYSYDPKECAYYKPRTLEDVLRDVWKEALDYAKSDMWRTPDEVFAERADEIRELLLGGDME